LGKGVKSIWNTKYQKKDLTRYQKNC
jgi:hypothetical protein